ncbi:hypothetical protein AKO1_000905 [Acrasis kona]|uniref:Uncharacterized protein n=1 Tax=Acrasis kona TaxID=1008807 RepID=A0AAW2ZPT4_9EUKA
MYIFFSNLFSIILFVVMLNCEDSTERMWLHHLVEIIPHLYIHSLCIIYHMIQKSCGNEWYGGKETTTMTINHFRVNLSTNCA